MQNRNESDRYIIMKKINELEIKLYEMIGVRFFQGLVFSLERFIHRRDGGTNQNYHFSKNHKTTMLGFRKYLFYNAAIHVRNIFIIIFIFVVKYILKRLYWIDILLILLLLKDFYCVMLQRYNYLRIQKVNELNQQRREKRINQKYMQFFKISSEQFSKSESEEMLKLVRKIIAGFDNNDIVYITSDDEQHMKKMIKIIKS